MNLIRRIIHWFSRNTLPYWIIILVDCAIVFASGVVTYWLFNHSLELYDHRYSIIYSLVLYMMISLVGAKVFSTYAGIVRYSSFVDLLHVAYANSVSIVLALIITFVLQQLDVEALTAFQPLETIILFVISTFVMWMVRVLVKAIYDSYLPDKAVVRALIYGALTGGVGLAQSIQLQRPRRFILDGFISHDRRSEHIMLMGKKVYNINDDLYTIVKQRKIRAILVSPLRVNDFRNNQELQNTLISAGCKIYMAQNIREASIKDGQLTTDDIHDMQLREVSVEDLLPRQEIKVDMESVGEQLRGKRILITGAAGSIGSEMVRQVAQFQPARMMLIDQAETPEHNVRLMMANEHPDIVAETIVASICDKGRMEHLFSTFRPDYVFHAAAYKHVPMMEDNPSEAVHNNILGTRIIADLSVRYGVQKFVMVSTDKAVNPTNVMGCSKRICEIYVQSLSHSQQTTQFVTTRFGNVLGSNGSVIPLFREQIRNGGPVTVTDERIVRFFMLIPEACQLVLEAGTKGHGGEIFVFDMGQPVRIADLARRMIQLSGSKNIEIKYTGLRAGEKLYEEVLSELENTKPSFHDKLRIAEVREYDYQQVCHDIDDLVAIARQYDNMATVRKMKQIVPEFKSNNSIYEQIDRELESANG
ncbi:MAG: polysaccharide biosynthesis protein [Bacteroidales bacterium]|nr:polysaccharide biosynthesis protein [Bacteroidales bacterium]